MAKVEVFRIFFFFLLLFPINSPFRTERTKRGRTPTSTRQTGFSGVGSIVIRGTLSGD